MSNDTNCMVLVENETFLMGSTIDQRMQLRHIVVYAAQDDLVAQLWYPLDASWHEITAATLARAGAAIILRTRAERDQLQDDPV